MNLITTRQLPWPTGASNGSCSKLMISLVNDSLKFQVGLNDGVKLTNF